MNKKRTCTGCKALDIDYTFGYKCGLGYPTKRIETKDFIRYVPCGIMTCPKPLTYSDYIFAGNNYTGEKK
jgi:hypothetical protein